MKRQIRLGVFETNSSSSHTLCFTNRDAAYIGSIEREHRSEYPETNTLTISFGQFGWGPEVYIDELHKLRYALTMVGETEKYSSIEEFYETEGFKNINNLIKEYTPYIDGIEIPEDEFDFTHSWGTQIEGNIDHESLYSLQQFLDKHDITLYDFIFNPDIVLVIDNDNH